MPAQTTKIRARFFVAVEGESEQSFVKWLHVLSSQQALHIHLDGVVLGGGGFKSMLRDAVRYHKRRRINTRAYKDCFLIVDGDRAEQGDWSIEKLRREAGKHRFTVCVQRPNHEGLLLRMMRGMEREIPDSASLKAKLRSRWPHYAKPVNAYALERQFSLDDVLRMASFDSDFGTLLKRIGLQRGP